MALKNDIPFICSSLETLGQQKLADDIRNMERKRGRLSMDDITACINDFAARFSNERFDRYFRRAKIGIPCYWNDVFDIPEQKLDKEYLHELNTLDFVLQHRNLIVWGPPGTGKTWISKMIATSACAKGLRTRWTTFPVLYDQMFRLSRSTAGQTIDSKLDYYSRFDILCIDEFPNVTEMDCMLVHRIFHKFYEKQTSLLLCMQAQPERMEDLFTVKGVGQSDRCRTQEECISRA